MARLLFDQNLARGLVARVADAFPGSAHVVHLNLSEADDRAIAEYAADNGYLLCSKDSDFTEFLTARHPRLKLVWIRLGNCTSDEVVAALIRARPGIEALATSDALDLVIVR